MMKIHCVKADMARGVQAIQSALSSRTTLPILLNFLIETEDSKLKLISTDLDLGIKHYIPAEVESAGSITVPAKKFSEILQSLRDDQEMELSSDSGGRLHINSGRSRFSLAGAPKSEYPTLLELDMTGALTIPSSVLSEMLRKTIFAAAAVDETRRALNGVFWAGYGGALDMVATDGRRLALIKRKCLPEDREFRAIVPIKALTELLRLLGLAAGPEDPVSFVVGENQIAFQFKTTTFSSRLVDGSFPGYEGVVPAQRNIRMVVGAEALSVITKRASLCASERGGSVRYTVRPGALHVQASSQTMEFDDEIPIDYSGVEFQIGFNPQFILDGLKNIGSSNVVFSVDTPANPVLIEAEGDPAYQYVVMPIRA